MKKTRVWLAVAGGLCGVGLVLAACGFAMSGFDIYQMDGSVGESKMYTAKQSQSVEQLEVDIENLRLQIEVDETATQIQVEYQESTRREFTVEQVGHKLKVYARDVRRWYNPFVDGIMQLDIAPVRVILPKNYAGSITGKTRNGRITLTGLHTEQAVLLSTTNAKIELQDVSCYSLQATSTNGKIDLNTVSIQEALSATTSNAKCELLRVSAKSGSVHSTNGKLELTDVHLQETLRAETSNGAIVLERLQAPDIELHTRNGSIKGSIDGRQQDYNIICTTTNGSAEPGSSSIDKARAKQLLAETTNASIRLEFVQQ